MMQRDGETLTERNFSGEVKRLLCIVGNMDAGGAETFLMKMYRKLNRDCYQMDFCVSGDTKGYYDDEIIDLGGKIFHIAPKSKSFTAYARGLKNIYSTKRYEQVLRIGSSAFAAIDLWIAKKCGIPLRAMRSSNASDGMGATGTFLHKIMRVPLTSAANVKIAPSDLAGSYTFGPRAVKKRKVAFLTNAIDLEAYKYQEGIRKEARKKLGIADGQLIIGHIGRLSKQKNHSFLLESFAGVRRRCPDALLLLVGRGELEATILEQAKNLGIDEGVRLLGVRSDIPALLSAFDVLAFPSLYEGMPNVVIEAQAAGLPCVIADTITREANVTGHVEYLPIDNPAAWVSPVIKAALSGRYDGTGDLRAAGYDINEEVKKFVELVYA